MEFEYIQNYYKVPAEMHREILFEERKGLIVKDKGNYLGVIWYDDPKQAIYNLHPTYNVTYLETFGNPPKVKNQRSKQRYQDYLHSDGWDSFADYLGIK